MGSALKMFLDDHGQDIIRRNLYRNFILHLTDLFDFAIISPATMYRTIGYLQQFLIKYPERHDIMKQAWQAQARQALNEDKKPNLSPLS